MPLLSATFDICSRDGLFVPLFLVPVMHNFDALDKNPHGVHLQSLHAHLGDFCSVRAVHVNDLGRYFFFVFLF